MLCCVFSFLHSQSRWYPITFDWDCIVGGVAWCVMHVVGLVERWLLFRPGQCSSGLLSLQPSPPVKSVSFHPLLPLWPWKVMYLCLLIMVLRNWARKLGYFLERTTKVMDRVASLHPFSIHSSIEIRFLNCQSFCWGTDQKFGYPLQSLFFKLR